jgi:hypothetical protein
VTVAGLIASIGPEWARCFKATLSERHLETPSAPKVFHTVNAILQLGIAPPVTVAGLNAFIRPERARCFKNSGRLFFIGIHRASGPSPRNCQQKSSTTPKRKKHQKTASRPIMLYNVCSLVMKGCTRAGCHNSAVKTPATENQAEHS